MIAGGDLRARRNRERAAWRGFRAHDHLGPKYSAHVSQAANQLIDPAAVAAELKRRWPDGTTMDPGILRQEIRMILADHARLGALGPALTDVYRAGWSAGEHAAADAIRRRGPKKSIAVPLHERPAPNVG